MLPDVELVNGLLPIFQGREGDLPATPADTARETQPGVAAQHGGSVDGLQMFDLVPVQHCGTARRFDETDTRFAHVDLCGRSQIH